MKMVVIAAFCKFNTRSRVQCGPSKFRTNIGKIGIGVVELAIVGI